MTTADCPCSSNEALQTVLWPVFKTLFLDIWALIRRRVIEHHTLLYNLSLRSLIPNPSFPPSQHSSPLVLHIFSAAPVSLPHTPTEQQEQDPEPSFGNTNKLSPANSTPVVQRDPSGSSERVSNEVLHCHVWEESKGVTTHGPRSFLCCAAPSFHQHLHWGCGKAGLEAGFTQRCSLNISVPGGTGKRDLFHSALTLEEANASFTVWVLRAWWWFLHLCSNTGSLPLFSSEILLQGGEKYNALLWDTSAMEEQAGHIHVCGFKMDRTPGTLHTLQFSELWDIFRSECRVTSVLCRNSA